MLHVPSQAHGKRWAHDIEVRSGEFSHFAEVDAFATSIRKELTPGISATN